MAMHTGGPPDTHLRAQTRYQSLSCVGSKERCYTVILQDIQGPTVMPGPAARHTD